MNESGFATVSVWKILQDIRVAPLYYSESVIEVHKDIEAYKTGNKKQQREWNKVSRATLDVSDLILEFFCDEFSKSNIEIENDYKFSVSYMRKLQQANKAVAPQFESDNLSPIQG